MSADVVLLDYVLQRADANLVLAQRLCEWVGKGPILEEDIATTNVGLDLLGQARLWYAYASDVERLATGQGRSEDELAFRRDAHQFRNVLLVEQPNGNYADTIARQFLFDQWHLLLLRALSQSPDPRIAEIAVKSVKEVAYHIERSSDWVVRLGDGTDTSHQLMQQAIDALWRFTGELFTPGAAELALVERGVAPDVRSIARPWSDAVDAVLREATLVRPADGWSHQGGKAGVHTEHLGRMLAEMQFLQRAYPDAAW
jgi:ring-1,2-phenylacetyl-CoA epoxidase subunit PaaC